MSAGTVEVSVGPLTREGLDEALSLTVGLGTIRAGEVVSDAELPAGCGEGFGAVTRTVIGHEAGEFDAVQGVEGDDLHEGGDDAGDFLVGMDAGEAEAGVIIDGDVERLSAGAFVAVGAIAGAANAWSQEAAELLDVQVDEFAGRLAFVADRWRGRGQEVFEPVQSVALEHTIDGGPTDRDEHRDLGVALALASQRDDARFEFRRRLSGLTDRHEGTGVETGWTAVLAVVFEPAADTTITDPAFRCCGTRGQSMVRDPAHRLRSTQSRERSITVHVVRGGWR